MPLAETLTQLSETPGLVIGIFETTRKGSPPWMKRGAPLHILPLPRRPQPLALAVSLAASASVRGG